MKRFLSRLRRPLCNERGEITFFACFFVTFFVTAVTARIYPIAGIPNAYYEKKADSTMDYSEPLFKLSLIHI